MFWVMPHFAIYCSPETLENSSEKVLKRLGEHLPNSQMVFLFRKEYESFRKLGRIFDEFWKRIKFRVARLVSAHKDFSALYLILLDIGVVSFSNSYILCGIPCPLFHVCFS